MDGHNLDLIRGLEEELFKQSVRASAESVANLLSDDFIEFGRSGGVHDKEDVVRSLANETPGAMSSLEADGYKLLPLASDVVLLTYRSSRANDDGRRIHSLRSSIWTRAAGHWQMIFHQATPTYPPDER